MARMIREGKISSVELVEQHLEQIERVNGRINAAVLVMRDKALAAAGEADQAMADGNLRGALHGVPFSVKDSIDVAGVRTTAGTTGLRNAPEAVRDATLVARLKQAGGIPICKTNLPDLLFSFESDNLIFGRSNNPYDVSKTAGGSSGGEAALIAACGSPFGLGSDCLGSVRVPAAFCGITAIKPTSGRLPRTGHVPPVGGWAEKLWQIGPMARWTEDLVLAMELLAGEDATDFTSPPMPLFRPEPLESMRGAFFLENGVATCSEAVKAMVRAAAGWLSDAGVLIEEKRPPCVEQSYELEMSILGADSGAGIHTYLQQVGSKEIHPQLKSFTKRFERYGGSAAQLGAYWSHWDRFRWELARFFENYDFIVCPVYSQPALPHGASMQDENFAGFSYTMTWSVAGFPAATVSCGQIGDLPLGVQVVAKPWRDLTALAVCQALESGMGGWKAPALS